MTFSKLDHQHLLESSNALYRFDEFHQAERRSGEFSLSWTNILLASIAHSLLSIAEDSRLASMASEEREW